MIFKGFKEKSNQKYINKLLIERQVSMKQTKIQTVGVLLNIEEFSNVEAFNQFFNGLDVQQARTKIVLYVEDEKASSDLWGAFFNPKHIGWKGKISHPDLQLFVDTKFDMLICFYKAPYYELDLIAAKSQADFKVGISSRDQRFYDLIIEVAENEFNIFKKELTKYLTVLNKL